MYQSKTSLVGKTVSAAAALLLASSAFGATYGYGGTITTCTGTCDSFAALENGSTVGGALEINVGPSDSFTAADVQTFAFAIQSSQPLEPFDGTNPATANPLPIVQGIAEIRDTITVGGNTFTTGGTTDADGNLTSGTVLFEFVVEPFSSNAAWVILDIDTGTIQVCLFFATSGCIPGATETVVVEGQVGLIPPSFYGYEGDITTCTGTCDSFAALEVGSFVQGELEIAVGPNETFGADDILQFGFAIESEQPLEPFDGTNPATANPLPIAAGIAEIRDTITVGGQTFTTGGETDADGNFVSGTVLFEFVVEPFSSNAAWVILDLGTGDIQVCLFFATSGCIPGATETVIVNGAWTLVGDVVDSDGDGVGDDVDNCTFVANADQRDTNGDGYGNICDADLNNDCNVNFIDLGLLRLNFFTSDPDADFDGNGTVNFTDLGLLRLGFLSPPGPSSADPCTP